MGVGPRGPPRPPNDDGLLVEPRSRSLAQTAAPTLAAPCARPSRLGVLRDGLGSTSLTTTTAYDAASRPSAVSDPLGRAFGVSYDADDAPTLMQYPNGTETIYAYDARRRVTGIDTVETSTSTAIASFAYTLDSEGERTQVQEADGTVRQYGYDSIARLTLENVTGSAAK